VTLFERVLQARGALTRAGISAATASLDADFLARHALGWDLATWLARRTETADAAFEQSYSPLLERRIAREPVAYIRGRQEFWGRDFIVSPAVLIPRPETELLVETATALVRRHGHSVIVDVGTGSACIAISMALECAHASVWATDVSEAALGIARTNATRLGAGGRVRFVHGSYLATVPRPIDIIVSNPPYVADGDKSGLAPEVADHEPALALFGGPDGLRNVRTLLGEAAHALAPAGRLVIEIGYGQSELVEAEIQAAGGLALEEIRADLQGIARVVVARRIS
jgi:release factor glutamine methyltransferase